MTPHDVPADGEPIEAAAFLLCDPPPPFDPAAAHWTFRWSDPRVAWFEEATQVHVHARDPRHRVDAIPSERHVRVELDGEPLAESSSPVALFESGLPTRWYLPTEDVRLELLEPSGTATRCPYKGAARFYSARVGGELHHRRRAGEPPLHALVARRASVATPGTGQGPAWLSCPSCAPPS
jgi:uncharacterized protein (DUF427 family)